MKIKALLFAFLFAVFMSAPLYASNLININTATAKEMTVLKGIGNKIAEKIVAYREAHGDFSSIDDLAKVSGISTKTVEKNREKMTAEVKKEK